MSNRHPPKPHPAVGITTADEELSFLNFTRHDPEDQRIEPEAPAAASRATNIKPLARMVFTDISGNVWPTEHEAEMSSRRELIANVLDPEVNTQLAELLAVLATQPNVMYMIGDYMTQHAEDLLKRDHNG